MRRRALGDERGAAMATVIGVIVIVAMLGVVSVRLSVHSIQSSERFRNTTSAVHAAESGLNHALSQLAGATGATWCGQAASTATQLPGGATAPGGQQFEITVSDSGGVAGTCSAADPIRLVRAVGFAPTAAAPDALRRTMEAQVRLVPETATPSGFNFNSAIHADSSDVPINISNSVNLLGDGTGNNADVYSNDDTLFLNSNEIHGDVISQGSITLRNSVHVYGDVWAAGSVTLQNSALVDGNVTAATGSITLSNSARINGSARAATTITQGTGQIIGAKYPNSPSAPPPAATLPTFTFNASDPAWPQPVRTYSSCADFNTYLNANKNNFSGTHRITSDCETLMSGALEVKVTGKTALVTDGWIRMRNSMTWTAQSTGLELWLISLHNANPPPPSTSDTKGIAMENSTAVVGMPVFLFARNQVTKANSVNLNGQMYASRVSIQNAFSLTFRGMSPPGFAISSGGGGGSPPPNGYNTQVLYVREVRNV